MFKVKLVGTTNKTYTVKRQHACRDLEGYREARPEGSRQECRRGDGDAGVDRWQVLQDGFQIHARQGGQGLRCGALAQIRHRELRGQDQGSEARHRQEALGQGESRNGSGSSRACSRTSRNTSLLRRRLPPLWATEVEALKFKGSGADKKAAPQGRREGLQGRFSRRNTRKQGSMSGSTRRTRRSIRRRATAPPSKTNIP